MEGRPNRDWGKSKAEEGTAQKVRRWLVREYQSLTVDVLNQVNSYGVDEAFLECLNHCTDKPGREPAISVRMVCRERVNNSLVVEEPLETRPQRDQFSYKTQ